MSNKSKISDGFKRCPGCKKVLAYSDYPTHFAGKPWGRCISCKPIQEQNRKLKISRTIYELARDGGLLEKSSFCWSCLCQNRAIHGHHQDYLKPLEVIWLCVSCHMLVHSPNEQ